MTTKHLLLLAGALTAAAHCHAYEQATHAMVARYAYERSDLGSNAEGQLSPLLRRLGLDTYAALGDGEHYFEVSDLFRQGQPVEHDSQDYEKNMIRALTLNYAEDPVRAWLMYGAIREDDNPNEDPATPQDVAPGVKRPIHHFYDPYNNRALDVPGLAQIEDNVHTNPDWAIGANDSFANPNVPESGRENSFTLFDAREAMFRALTLQSYSNGTYTDIGGAEESSARQQQRRMYWAGALRALGDVLHLNQDMAQPQHTRNEPHSGKACPIFTHVCLAGHTSIYEKYINARVTGARTFDSHKPFNTTVTISAPPIVAGAYPIPQFARITDYWSTATLEGSLTGRGLANYSNQGFFTAGKNLDSSEYPMPPRSLDAYKVRSVSPVGWDGSTVSGGGPAYVLFGTVSDPWQGTIATEVPLTSYSYWDQFLKERGEQLGYTLNRLNYDAMADLLIPRAVSYSTGLINYFFRGQLEITAPDEGVFALADHADPKGFAKIRAKVRNQTRDFTTPGGAPSPQTMEGGDLIAVVRFHKDLQYDASLDTVVGVAPCDEVLAVFVETNPGETTNCRDGTEEIIVSPPITGVSIDRGSYLLAEFDFGGKSIPFGVTDLILQIVYRGPLGSEANAVAVGTIDLSEPTYFTYQNASDYVRIGDHVYTRDRVAGDRTLLDQVQPPYCVDRTVSPPTLRPECLQPFSLDLMLAIEDLGEPLAVVTQLPVRHFVRIAYLTAAEESTQAPPKAARSSSYSSPLRLHVRRPSSGPKAALLNDGTCLPHDSFIVPPRIMQITQVTWIQITAHLTQFSPLRGVNGYYSTSCVIDGSGATPGSPDDRKDVMEGLTRDSDEVKPVPVTIMSKYLSGAN